MLPWAHVCQAVTACYKDLRFDEWKYADAVVQKTSSKPHRVFTEFKDIAEEFEAFAWHQDEPVANTSMFSQWAVFKKAHEAGLKVMIDGQGADEQLAGYSGNDIPLYAGLLHQAKFGRLYKEIAAYKNRKGNLPVSFILGALQTILGPSLSKIMPSGWKINNILHVDWLDKALLTVPPADKLSEGLYTQIRRTPLPGLLRYEDRNSMAWSIESRTPFMDYRLFEFNLGLPEHYVYSEGVTKRILREAMKNMLPESVAARRDKMGFVTPEELWMKNDGRDWFTDRMNFAVDRMPSMVSRDKLRAEVNATINGTKAFNFLPWRVAILGNWIDKNF
jgi:asparagine synthase (glutamine-hydrolysing)